MPGSLDTIADAVEHLEKAGVFYVLVIGREHESITRSWANFRAIIIDKSTEDHVCHVVRSTFQNFRDSHPDLPA